MTDYSTEAQAVADAMNAVYENKQTNKKNTLTGDYSSDNVSYPTCKAVQAAYGSKVESWSSTVSDSNIPSEKLVKDTLDTKQATLVSGTNIKTVNNQSLLGSGNVSIDGLSGNIVTSWSSTTSDSKVPSEKLTKTSLDGKINTSDIVTNTAGWSGTTSDSKVPSEKLVKNSLDNKAASSHTHGNIQNNGGFQVYTGSCPVMTNSSGIIVEGSFGTTAGTFAEGNHTHSTYEVTVEKQQTAETGYAHTYVIKQGGTALSPKINIPKDYLVKSGEIKTCTTANVPVQGYVVGDKYLDFVVNVKAGSATDEHIYILVKDLVDVYTADNSTLQLSNGQFSIKNGGVGSDQIASAVKSSWLSTSDVQSEISDFAAALAEAINPSST